MQQVFRGLSVAHDLEKDRLMKYQLPIQDFICSYQDFYLQEARLKKEGGRNINLNVEEEEENADKQDKELTEAEKQEAEEKQPKKRIKVDCPLRIGKPAEGFLNEFFLFSSSS